MINFNDFIIKKPVSKKVVVIGHPRCGSGFAAHVLSSVGLDVGHEVMGENGISSWMFAVDDERCPFGPGYAKNNYLSVFEYTLT